MHTSSMVKFASGLVPKADYHAGGTSSDVLNMRDHSEALFVIYEGASTGGQGTVTVNSCDDATPTTTTPVAFEYKRINGKTNVDGAWTSSAATGFATTANTSTGDIYVIRVKSEDLSGTDGYVQLQVAEKTNSPTTGAILALLLGGRYPADIQRAQIT